MKTPFRKALNEKIVSKRKAEVGKLKEIEGHRKVCLKIA